LGAERVERAVEFRERLQAYAGPAAAAIISRLLALPDRAVRIARAHRLASLGTSGMHVAGLGGG